jgi:hypothetical protein
MGKKQKKSLNRISLVVGVHPENFLLQDKRFMKPICHQNDENGEITGSMIVQELDCIKLNKNREATYYLPNNIALLLSTCERALILAKNIYDQKLINPSFEVSYKKMVGDKKKTITEVSSLICDYLENIQTAIVFGYTALETFSNLSIPSNYKYETEKNQKGIIEIFDKKAIERWLTLKEKIKNVLTDVYKTSKIDKQKWWGHFSNLEKYRNDIIHQKSIDRTDFYKEYFDPGIFEICKSPEKVILFFHDSLAENNRTNPIWPWLNSPTSMPINRSFNSQYFEVMGNIHEDIAKESSHIRK